MSKRIEIQEEMDLEQAEAVNGSETAGEDSRAQAVEQAADAPGEEELAQRLEEAEQKANDYYDKLLRVSADFENYKKRTAREMGEVVKYSNEKLIKELLSVVDNLERAIESASGSCNDDDPLIKGVHLTLSETLKILEKHQVKPINAIGEPFDPSYHQAMLQEEVQDQPPNTVVKELQKGYLIHDRLLRPALVSVSKAGSPEGQGTP